jgi:4-hydroxy-tetrahydrodipicolinate synthase
MYRGSLVALITPFRDGRVDEAALKRLIEFQIAQGTHGLVPCGTTGESSTLSVEEHERVIALTVEVAAKRVPVVAGTGSNNTVEAIELTRAAKAAGADAALSVAPYYNRPTQEGLYQHYLKIAEATDFPFILYNIQSRTGVNVLPETIARIAKDCPLLVGVKEASGSLEQISRLHALLGNRVPILSGDDGLTLPILAVGGTGIISVAANIAPGPIANLVELWEAGKQDQALALHERLMPLVRALFLETNPGPVKAASSWLGFGGEELRLPLVQITDDTRQKLRQAMLDFGLLR